VLVATHNLMHGRKLPRLIARYAELREKRGLDVLCIQENQGHGHSSCAEHIAEALGREYCSLCSVDRSDVALIYNRDRFELVAEDLIPLPRLAALSLLERMYIAGGRPGERQALVAILRPRGAAPLAVVSFHLDTAGGNSHRRAQVQAIAAHLARVRRRARLAVCGDTNAFAWSSRRQPAALAELLAPLCALGARDAGDSRPTHFFARQDEPLLTHRITLLLGKLGIDLPLRYDVICTDLAVAERGRETTPESDHDLVWVRLSDA
jgi:endonuclease/exonuclease/phosphatase family metal-dependent hydrolase